MLTTKSMDDMRGLLLPSILCLMIVTSPFLTTASKMKDMMSSMMGSSSDEESSGSMEVMILGSNGQMMSG